MSRLADEGVITNVAEYSAGRRVITLDNGNSYNVSRTCLQDIHDPAFRGVTVRLLLTEAHRIWDISVI